MNRKVALLAVLAGLSVVLVGCMMMAPTPLNVGIQMPNQAIVGEEISFTSNVGGCQQCQEAYYEYEWQFGDGAMSMAQNPTHTYGAAGTYSVALSVIARCSNGRTIGCGDATSTIVIVEPTPGPIPEPMPPCPTPCPPPCPPPCPVPPEPEPQPEPEPLPPDPCDVPPIVDVPVSREYPVIAINFQLIAYQPNIHSGGCHLEDMRRVIIVFENLSSHEVVASFDTWEQQPDSNPIPTNGRLLVNLPPGDYQVRGVGWNMCDTCPVNKVKAERLAVAFGIKSVPGGLTCEFAHNFKVIGS